MSETFIPSSVLPLFPISGCILLPGEMLPLNVFEPRYLNMLDDVMDSDGALGIIQSKPGGRADAPHLETIGTLGRVISFTESEDGRYLIVLQGGIRFRISEEMFLMTPYRQARVDYHDFTHDIAPMALTPDIEREHFMATLREFFDANRVETDWDAVEAAPLTTIADKVSMSAPFRPEDKQALLEAPDPALRVATLLSLMEESLNTSDACGPKG